MNRWYIAALAMIAASVAWVVFVPPPPNGCPGAGFNECGGFNVSPTFAVFVGLFLAGVCSLAGFIRNTK